jgi:acylphosphatase
MEKQFAIRVTGRVQGVGFRYAARTQARSLGLKGWVENLPDGSVRMLVQGRDAGCRAFIAWCRRGPGYSWVEGVEIEEREPGALEPFHIR